MSCTCKTYRPNCPGRQPTCSCSAQGSSEQKAQYTRLRERFEKALAEGKLSPDQASSMQSALENLAASLGMSPPMRPNPGITDEVLVEAEKSKIYVTSPYNQDFINRARELSGKWDSRRRQWVFDIRNLDRVEKLLVATYGTDGTPTQLVDIQLSGRALFTSGNVLEAFGRTLAERRWRDSGVTYAGGVVLVEGGATRDRGTRKYPNLEFLGNTIIEVRDVPRRFFEEGGGYKHLLESGDIKIVRGDEGKKGPVDVRIEKYNKNAIVVRGDTVSIKEDLNGICGLFTYRLKGGPGWLFPASRRKDVEALLVKVASPRPNPLPFNATSPLIFLGTATTLKTETHSADGEGLMFCDAGGTSLLIVPPACAKKVPASGLADPGLFARWHGFKADTTAYEIDLPDDMVPAPCGFAERITYRSDKIQLAGDQWGTEHEYVHDFDAGQRAAFQVGPAIIVQNLKINHRGILN